MTNAAVKTSAVVVPIEHGKIVVSEHRRFDSDRLIQKGKDLFQRIPQTHNTFPDRLDTRIYRRTLALLGPKYQGDNYSSQVIALHIQNAFLMLLTDPEKYYGFFDVAPRKGTHFYDMFLTANGCILTAALYSIPPLQAFWPDLYRFYAHHGIKIFSALHGNNCGSTAISLLASEEHTKKTIEVLVELFNYPSKI